jgi:hypothetical protein
MNRKLKAAAHTDAGIAELRRAIAAAAEGTGLVLRRRRGLPRRSRIRWQPDKDYSARDRSLYLSFSP